MKDLHIPDVHLRLTALKRVLRRYQSEVDRIIYHGDFFDNWREDDEGLGSSNTRAMSKWLAARIASRNNKDVWLWSNHDMAYGSHGAYGCAGWDEQKQEIVDEYMTQDHWDVFDFWSWNDTYLASHAGFHPSHAHPIFGVNRDYMDGLHDELLELVRHNKPHHLFNAGRARYGSQEFGGVTWLDWKNFAPIDNVSQIVGHTIVPSIQYKLGKNSHNYCIDTDSEMAVIVEPGREIKFVEI